MQEVNILTAQAHFLIHWLVSWNPATRPTRPTLPCWRFWVKVVPVFKILQHIASGLRHFWWVFQLQDTLSGDRCSLQQQDGWRIVHTVLPWLVSAGQQTSWSNLEGASQSSHPHGSGSQAYEFWLPPSWHFPQLQIERQQRAQNFIVHSLRRETWAQAPIRVGKASTALPTEQTPLPLSTNGYRMRSNHWIEERDRKIFLQVPAASKIKKGN